MPTDFGFVVGSGREHANGDVSWNVNVMLMPFHKVISSIPMAAHVWAPIDDEHTMLYSVTFNPDRPMSDADLERSVNWRGIHTENIPGADHAIRNKSNDYLIDRELQASGRSYSGMKGLGTQDCAIQESMGPVSDRTKEYLLLSDTAIVKLRRLLLQTLKDHAEGRPLPGANPESFRVRSARFEARSGESIKEKMSSCVRLDKKAYA